MSESFGRYLKRERKLREILLEEIARETKIKIGLLRALEDDRIGDLPSPAIVKGFLRSYARMLGLSANVSSFATSLSSAGRSGSATAPVLRPGFRKQRRLGAVGVASPDALRIGVGLHLTGSEPASSGRSRRHGGQPDRTGRIPDRDQTVATGYARIVAAGLSPAPAAAIRPAAGAGATTAALSLDGGRPVHHARRASPWCSCLPRGRHRLWSQGSSTWK
jgi:cytoskeleton protein RodZ